MLAPGNRGQHMDNGFNPLGALTNWVRGLACTVGLLVAGNICTDLYVVHLLRQIRDGTVDNDGMLGIGLLGAARLQGLVNVAYALFFLANIVLFFVWLHRAARNVRALGATSLEFTPGWTVGYFFIPVINLVMPYLAVREIWQHSRPMAGRGSGNLPVLAWWLTYLAASIVTDIKTVMMHDAHGLDASIHVAYVEVVNMALMLIASLFFIHLVGRIWHLQESARHSQVRQLPPLPSVASA